MANIGSLLPSSPLGPKSLPLKLNPTPTAAQKRIKSMHQEDSKTSESSRNIKKQRTGDAALLVTTPTRKTLPEITLFGKSLILDGSTKDDPLPKSSSQLVEFGREKKAITPATILPYNYLEEVDESRRMKVSTELKMYEDPWKIRKKLRESDVGKHHCRLLVATDFIKNHILPFLPPSAIKEVENLNGVRVFVWDIDTWTGHTLVLKQWSSANKNYVFNDGWTQDFVRRRKLKKDDEIGLYWDSYYSRLHFAVLKKQGVD
ncbi:hypothetical protein Tsubulata_025438 [Turnera subulata]|uniref:TF-B3 domain-containing protein n=1 Tax=Turnera subulata TaxID=218843 RepID=A0A9Q0JJS4_9ROSI|nr:hypothetical protein Tsubulata_025438 [Turnera subulata]